MVGNFGAKPACYHRLLGMLATRYRILYLEGGNAKDLPDYATINSVNLDSQSLGENLLVDAVAVGEMIHHNDDLLLHMELIDVSDGSQTVG